MSSPESLERRLDELRVAIRRAVAAGDLARARELRTELRAAEQAWDNMLAKLSGRVADAQQPGAALLPIREQVHQALTLLGVAASPRLIVAVHDAFSSGTLVAARLTSLRRDEERSFRSAPHARAYYLCAALTADLLAPARGLLAVSTWPLERRVIGPLSPRVDFLRAAIAVADSIMRFPDRGPEALALLRRFAVSIPGAEPGQGGGEPGRVVAAAQAELEVHLKPDQEHRQAAAERAQAELDDTGRLFGSRPRAGRSRGPGTGS
ncbi:MAG: hypothetical protein J2P28_07580 [Actinobacteria bacterium]|nr:hypothetical protein [Actinomycetota bacterium]MBO0835365.1 hypothetical protein [Actinomycetota bacterium]